MEKSRGFNFKLFVPPRVNSGQLSADAPQVYSKCFDKEPSMSFPNTSLLAPTKPTRQDFPTMRAVSPMKKDESYSRPGQLYCKLFDEVEKIKCWKVKVDSDTVQKERLLQENKTTIEAQRTAIQELQYENESLSIKLEEQIAENEDLRNKNTTTRNLCSLLKDTFERAAEKMHLFETEREETHHLCMENSEIIQKQIAAFESLHIQAKADQQELQKAKENLLCFEELKQKYQQQCNVNKVEVAALQAKLKEKGNELEQVLFDLHESQKHCQQLQETANQQYELLRSSETEKQSLSQKLQTAEQRRKESEQCLGAITASLEQSTKEYAEKLAQMKATAEELQSSLFVKTQRVKELEDKLTASSDDMERTKTLLGEIMEQSAKKDEQIEILANELDNQSKSFELMKSEMDMTADRVAELTIELSKKSQEAKRFENEAEMAFSENGLLKRAREAAEKAHEELKEHSMIKVQELEAKLLSETNKTKEHASQIKLLRNDIMQHKEKYNDLLSSFNELQSEKVAIEQQRESGSSFINATKTKMKVNEERIVTLTKENQSLREELDSISSNIQRKCHEAETLQTKIEENCELLLKKLAEKDKQIKAVETKLCRFRKKVEMKLGAKADLQKENKLFKKQIVKETAKCTQLESVISGLHKESQTLKRLNEEDNRRLLTELEANSALVTELETQVQELRLTAADAVKNKEDAEVKCQQKISDMVALMEKHKSQYDRMVEENDAELRENKKKEAEAVALTKSLELDLLKHKTENDQLKKQLRQEAAEKENLRKEMTDLSEAANKQSQVWRYRQGRWSETPQDRSSERPAFDVFDFSNTRKTLYSSKDVGGKTPESLTDTESLRTSPKTKEMKTIRNSSSKIRSYRIKTPPSAEKAAGWATAAIELEPMSDSPSHTDLLTLANAPSSLRSAPDYHASIRRKIRSPATHKSPGTSLKLAAMKRMRDAGWIAVTGCDKKKKKTSEKVFA